MAENEHIQKRFLGKVVGKQVKKNEKKKDPETLNNFKKLISQRKTLKDQAAIFRLTLTITRSNKRQTKK